MRWILALLIWCATPLYAETESWEYPTDWESEAGSSTEMGSEEFSFDTPSPNAREESPFSLDGAAFGTKIMDGRTLTQEELNSIIDTGQTQGLSEAAIVTPAANPFAIEKEWSKKGYGRMAKPGELEKRPEAVLGNSITREEIKTKREGSY